MSPRKHSAFSVKGSSIGKLHHCLRWERVSYSHLWSFSQKRDDGVRVSTKMTKIMWHHLLMTPYEIKYIYMWKNQVFTQNTDNPPSLLANICSLWHVNLLSIKKWSEIQTLSHQILNMISNLLVTFLHILTIAAPSFTDHYEI